MRLKKDKSGDTVGRPSWRSSLSGDPGAKFFCGKPQHMKNSLNFANTCLKVIDTRRCAHGIIRRLILLNRSHSLSHRILEVLGHSTARAPRKPFLRGGFSEFPKA